MIPVSTFCKEANMRNRLKPRCMCLPLGRGQSGWELLASRVTTAPFIAVFTRVGAAGFSTIFFDHSYIFAHALLDIQHLNDSTGMLDFYGILMASLRAFGQH